MTQPPIKKIKTMEKEEKIVVLKKYTSPIDANIVKGALEASGIPIAQPMPFGWLLSGSWSLSETWNLPSKSSPRPTSCPMSPVTSPWRIEYTKRVFFSL